MHDFRLPDLGEGVTEGEIDRWLVQEGDVVEEDTSLVEIITDKATAEIPSPFAGTVLKIHHAEGEIVPVGTVLISIGEVAGAGRGGEADTGAPPQYDEKPPAGGAESSAPPAETSGNGRVKAMPPVRRLARDLGVDLTTVSGSGPGGRILREDVEAIAARARAGTVVTGPARGGTDVARPASAGPEATAPAPAERAAAGRTHRPGQRVPVRGVRRTIAEKMLEAQRTIPSVTHVEECDVTELDGARRALNERYPDLPRLSYLPFVITATVRALKAFPELNSSLDEERGEIVLHDRYHIGVATHTPQGLVVPVIRDADARNLHELAAELARLSSEAREGRIKPEDLRGGTFTITSPGKLAGLMATPIIMAPQSAILGVHRAVERPWVVERQIVIRKIMNIGVTFDHRVMDGMTAARFNQEIVALLEHPALLLYEP